MSYHVEIPAHDAHGAYMRRTYVCPNNPPGNDPGAPYHVINATELLTSRGRLDQGLPCVFCFEKIYPDTKKRMSYSELFVIMEEAL